MVQPAFPAASETLLLDGPAGALEVAVDLPEPADARALVAVVCHPLPTEGGTMHNKVVTMVARALRELGATTVRFNFRGTGQSAGAFDHGAGEREDLRAVVDWVRAGRPGDALWLAGFSFGAYVSLSASAELQPDALVSIAPPVSGRGWDFAGIEIPEVPWLVVQGDADEIVDAQAVYDWVDALPRRPQLVRMVDTSHFFHRKLIDLRGAIQHEVKAWLPTA
ncbi:alpha/beta hydrolase [Pseudoxanthomonas sp. 10H]|uniref:alpha/beta hydrolase n=1 Tax=Pseudoxanthomonas sp. 10H TaxID=3242729 RepID=UPI0035578FF8